MTKLIIPLAQFCERAQQRELLLYREIFAVGSQTHTTHINGLCGQKVEFLMVKMVVYKVTNGLIKVSRRTRNSSVSIVTRSWDGKPRKRGSILGAGNKLVFSPQIPDLFWGPFTGKAPGFFLGT
jgi:hypothetical protein